MAAQQQSREPAREPAANHERVKRRGILAVAGAVMASIAAKAVTDPVSATNGSPPNLGEVNTIANQATLPTGLQYNGSTLTPPNNSIFQVADHTTPLAAGNVVGAIAGIATTAVPNGVYGFTQVDGGNGVIGVGGTTGAGQNATGVKGISSGGGSAVLGQSVGSGPGVRGEPASGNTGNMNGVEGKGGNSFTGTVGTGGPNGGAGVIGFGGTAGTAPGVGAGVIGLTNTAPTPTPGSVPAGVYGNSQGTTGPGVLGVGGSTGMIGRALNGFGTGTGIYGTNNPSSAPFVSLSGGIGVQGEANGIGVYGASASGIGVWGVSNTAIGTRGDTNASGSFGVLGVTTATNSIALGGITNADNSSCFSGGTANPNAFAAFFQGHVQVTSGAFDVIPLGNKHGLAPHPDGTHRTFYSVESPECWVEDFGEGTVTAGKASVTLDADFATLVHTDTYHVFLTEHGGTHHHLSVEQKTSGGFTVVADGELAVVKGKKAADLSGTFSWRVVAKPKTTANVERLAKAKVGTFPLPDITKLPKPPETPPAKKS